MSDNTAETAAPNYKAIKEKQNAAWGSGDYAKVGTTLQIVGEMLAEAMDLPTRSSVLDVAAGNGNATLAFARRFNNVTSTDYVATLLEDSQARAKAEGLDIRYQLADVENLPFKDGEFDAVASTFGVMFAPNQVQSASELARVCRSGGKIGLANWTADSFIGALFKTLGKFVPPPPGVVSPANWGTPSWIDEQFSAVSSSIAIESRDFMFRYHSPQHFVDIFREFYGPVHKAFLALDEEKQSALEADILTLIGEFNTAQDGGMRVPGRYSEIVIVKA